MIFDSFDPIYTYIGKPIKIKIYLIKIANLYFTNAYDLIVVAYDLNIELLNN